MKKISEWVDVIREAEKRELSKLQQSYQDYFSAKLKKYGVESPADLPGDKKSEFFNEITKDWEKGQGASESGKKDVKEYGVAEGNGFSKMDESFEVHYSDGISAMKKFSDEKKAIAFMKDTIENNKKLKDIAIYKAGPKFHSTTDTDAVIAWWGAGSYLDNVSKRDPKLASKKINEELSEGNAFLAARAKAIEEGAEEFEFNGKVYQITTNGVNEADIKKSDIKKMIKDETKELESKVKKAETAAKDAEQKAKDAEAESKSAIKDAEKAQDRAGKGTVENKEDFREYAMKILKKQHPDDFDEEIANKVIDGLAKDAEKSGDWGSAIGRLNKG